MITFKEFIQEANSSGLDIQNKIGKTRFSAMIKHPYYKKFAQGNVGAPTAYRHHEDDVKHVVDASNDGKTMIQFHFHKINNRVSSAHLFTWDGTRHSDGSKMWQHVSTHGETNEEWQRAIMHKHGSVKPGYWHSVEKRFVSNKESKGGFDHARLVSINAEVEVNGKVVAGKRIVSESTEGLKDGKWILKHIGTVDGKPHGLGGDVDVYTGHSDDYKGNTTRYYIRPQRTGNVRLAPESHPCVRKCVTANENI
jgi:hypothetical protein